MNLYKLIPDATLKEALFLSLEDQDLEVRLRKLEEMLENLKSAEDIPCKAQDDDQVS